MYEHDPSGNDTHLQAWHSEEIDKIRVAASPGGVALSAEQAKELRDELDAAIDKVDA